MLCSFCEPLTIQGLLDLTRREFANQVFPPTAFYQHHASFLNLIASAEEGCELCQLIHRAFRETPAKENAANQSVGDEVGGDGKSLLSVIERLEQTGVKIALSAREGHLGDAIAFMTMLDVLMVQVGPAWEYPDPADRNRPVFAPTALKPVILNITVHPYYAPIYSGVHRIGRGRLDPNLGSKYNFTIARRWLWDCNERHETCISKKESPLPTRLIEICFERPPRVVLTNGATGEYGTLSHYWGGEVTPVLTTKALAEFQREIKLADLPSNFSDALIIAWHLGLKYIWIDSLCILQDSKEDWEAESGKMAAIYRNSTLTIAVLSSPSSKHGILSGGEPLQDLNEEKPPTIRLSAECGYGQHETVMLGCHTKSVVARVPTPSAPVLDMRDQFPKSDSLWELTPDAPLRRRAWTLQETFLSPRTLYYGSHQLYFHCPQGTECSEGVGDTFQILGCSESIGLPNPAIHTRMHDTGEGDVIFGRGKESVEAMFMEYYQLVEDFTTRKITFDSDKLPAFSGIAETFHSFVGGEYLAGIWTKDLPRGLLWDIRAPVAPHVRQPYRAPSWSWFVTNEPVHFGMLMDPFESEDVELLRCENKPRSSQNPYGEIKSCTLTLKGLTKKLVCTQPPQHSSLGELVASATFDEKKYTEGHESVFRVAIDNDDYLLIIPSDEDSQDTKQKQVEEYKEYLVLLVRNTTIGMSKNTPLLEPGPIDHDATWLDGTIIDKYNSLSLDPSQSKQPQPETPLSPEELNTTSLGPLEYDNEEDFFAASKQIANSGFLDGNSAWLSGHPLRGTDHGWHGDRPVTPLESEGQPFGTGECLLLEKTAEDTCERAGRLNFLPHCFYRDSWEVRTLTLT